MRASRSFPRYDIPSCVYWKGNRGYLVTLPELTREEKLAKCQAFMAKLFEKLNGYECDQSPYSAESSYCIPIGTNEQNSFYSKPMYSFRCSSHWNWYANLRKCSNPTYIQCNNVDVPWPRNRVEPGKASQPVTAYQVAFFDNDKRFHCVYGEKFNRKTKQWEWVESSVEDVIADLKLVFA